MKRKIKINFTDFWSGFNKEDNFFWNIFSKKYELELSDNPDILFYSYFGNEYRRFNCVRVIYMGENRRPDFKKCDFSFSFDITPEDPRNYRLPLYVLYDDLAKLTLPKNIDEIVKQKTNFCAFVVSNKFSQKRIKFFHKLSKYKKVDSGGAILNNLGTRVTNKIEFLRSYKFAIAFENSSYPGYTTEKIFEPMLVNTIPIYWGNPLVNLDFNHKSFINWHEYDNDDEVIEKIIEIDKNPGLYYEMLKQPYLINNEVSDFAKEERILQQFDYIVDSMANLVPAAVKYGNPIKMPYSLAMKLWSAKRYIKHYLRID
jgi:alpha(1,3/1,4) fucosyltransferase